MNEDYQLAVEQSLTRIEMRRRRARRKHLIYRRVVRLCWTLFFLGLLGLSLWWVRAFLREPFAIIWHRTPIVVLATEVQCEQAILQLKQSFAANTPEVIQFEGGEFTFERMKNGVPVHNVSEAVAVLQALPLRPVMDGYAIVVNGKPLVLLVRKEDAANALALMQQQALSSADGMPTFDQRIVIAHHRQQLGGKGTLLPLLTPSQAVDVLMHPPLPNVDIARHGDSLFTIAIRHQITIQQIKILNPNIDPRKLHPGDSVRLPDIPPPVSVTVHQ